MRRLEIAVLFVVGVVGGAVGSAWYFHQAPVATDKAAVEAIVTRMLDDTKAKQNTATDVAALDAKALDPLIENYLMNNPSVLTRMTDALDKQNKADQAVKDKQAIADNKAAIYDAADDVILGNPNGDVTLVEMFDYNCTYCRGALPDLATLLSTDKNLKVELKQFPILSQGSVDAAKVALQVKNSGKDYWAFHQALYASRGEVTGDTALDEAKTLGLDTDQLRTGMAADSVGTAIQKSYDLAKALNVSGTPTYIIGDTIIPGAVPLDQLKTAIANMRACGSAQSCPAKS